jgi:hypothetical protein
MVQFYLSGQCHTLEEWRCRECHKWIDGNLTRSQCSRAFGVGPRRSETRRERGRTQLEEAVGVSAFCLGVLHACEWRVTGAVVSFEVRERLGL